MSLEFAIQVVEDLEKEVDTTIRAEFSEYGDRLDEVIMLLRTTDRSDVHRLTSQLARMQAIVSMGTSCTCEAERRWHACLGRVSVAMAAAATRYNMESVRKFCEESGISLDDVLQGVNWMKPDSDELPDLPSDINIPNDASELTQ